MALRYLKSGFAQSDAKTAYDLLSDVCKTIKNEPKIYDQDTFMSRDNISPCGTVACRAGWIVALHDGSARLNLINIEDRATHILGFSGRYGCGVVPDSLFEASAFTYENKDMGRDNFPNAGTKAYARLGIKGLRTFMAKHKAHLKARLLKRV